MAFCVCVFEKVVLISPLYAEAWRLGVTSTIESIIARTQLKKGTRVAYVCRVFDQHRCNPNFCASSIGFDGMVGNFPTQNLENISRALR